MAIYNLGSINVDHVYRVASLPLAGETVSDTGLSVGLGGKGANQSIAIARSGGEVSHIGAIGAEGDWARKALQDDGVRVDGVLQVEAKTGHAIIYVDDAAENMIVIHGGANRAISLAQIEDGLAEARAGDWFLTQNETSLVAEAIATAKLRGLKIAYAAAPFDPEITASLIDKLDLIALNQIEADALARQMGVTIETLPVPMLLVTFGAGGAMLRVNGEGQPAVEYRVSGLRVDAVDTTGAGDTFLGAFLCHLDKGDEPADALIRATLTAALQVTRRGAASAIPTAAEVDDFATTIAVPDMSSYHVEDF